MRQRDHESFTDLEAQDDLFFDPADDDAPDAPGLAARPSPGPSRLEGRRRARERRRRGVFGIVAVLLLVLIVALGVFVGLPIYRYFNPSNYSGQGNGSVIVTVAANDGATQIGATLVSAGVVASQRAFTDAADANANSRDIQPGSYRMRRHMSAADAIIRLLEPAARVNTDVVVTEGATIFDVASRLSSPPCTASSPSGTICGIGLSKAAVTKALDNVNSLGLPTEFTVGATPKSAEGFLYPATYPFDADTDADTALQTMVGKFTDQARSTDFTAQAKVLGLTPYQELIIASMVQSEAKYPDDMAKVARVILNRLQQNINLKIDATSVYGAEVLGLDPTKTIHSQLDSPYNTYTHAGLPPTPISNPGAEAMNAAAHPATGDWLYYVNDSPDRLFFTNSEAAFEKAVAACQAHNWGCA